LNTSSPQLTTSPILTVTCPDWCTDERPGHADDLRIVSTEWGDQAGPTVTLDHTGPRFGPFRGDGEQNVLTGAVHRFVHTVEENAGCDTSDPAVLRQHAAEALAAAQWLESHR
jgi:hypothetical protein